MNVLRFWIRALFCICVLLSVLQYVFGIELRCQCVNYYSGIPWTAKCVYLKPKSPECNKYELIVYYDSAMKTCVRVRNSYVFDNINEHTWFQVTNKPGTKQIKLKKQKTSCAVVS
ncbi:Ba158.1 [Baboon cytomegalovirus]|nr:Ba158.1 [Baboon cytomegalovirus]